MGNPESKQFDKHKKLPRPDDELTQKSGGEEVNVKKLLNEIEDDGTPVDECSSYEKQSEPCKLSGLPGEVVSELGSVDDDKPLLNVADIATEENRRVEQEQDIKQNPEIQRDDIPTSLRGVKEFSPKLDKQDHTEKNIEKGTALDEVGKLTIVVTREKQAAHLIGVGTESENISVHELDDDSKERHLIDLDSDSQYVPLINLSDNKSNQYSKYFNQNQELNYFNEGSSSSETNKDTCSLIGGRNPEINSLKEDGLTGDVYKQIEFPGEQVTEVGDSRDSIAETGSMNSLNSSSSSSSTSSSTSSRIRNKFSIKRLFRPFKRNNDDRSLSASTEDRKGKIEILKYSTNHAENILVDTSSIHRGESIDLRFCSTAEKEENRVFGHDLPVENKCGYKQKLTWRTNDNRFQMKKSGNEEDHKQSYGIYSNVIFLPDKMKGASPKRKGPKKLGSIISKVSSREVDSDSQSISSNIDSSSLSIDDNGKDIPTSGLNIKKLSTRDAPEIYPIHRPDTLENELEFVDDHFGLYTGCSASGVLKDFFDKHLCKGGQCSSSIEQKQTRAEDKIEDYVFHVQTAAKGCKDTIYKSMTKPSENPKLSNDKIEHCVDQKSEKFDLKNKKSVYFVPKEIINHLIDGSGTCYMKEVSNTPENTQRTICQTICPPTFRKNCTFDINWNILRSKQGHFARNMKSSVTNIAEDNRICLEFCLPFYEGRNETFQNDSQKRGYELEGTRFDYDDTVNLSFSNDIAKSPSAISNIEVIVNEFDDIDNEFNSESSQSGFADANASSDHSNTSHQCADEIVLEISTCKGFSENSEDSDDPHETENLCVFSFEQDHTTNNFTNEVKSHNILESNSSQNISSTETTLSFNHVQEMVLDISHYKVLSKYSPGSTENGAILLGIGEDANDLKIRTKEEPMIRDNTNSGSSLISYEKSYQTSGQDFCPDESVISTKDSAQKFGTTVSFQRFRTRCEHDDRVTADGDVDNAVIGGEREVQRHMNIKIPGINKVAKSSHTAAAEKAPELDSTKHDSWLKIVNDILTQGNEVKRDEEDNLENYHIKQRENVTHFDRIDDAINPNVYHEQINDNKSSENLIMEYENNPQIDAKSQQKHLHSNETNGEYNSVYEANDGFVKMSKDCAVKQQEIVDKQTNDCAHDGYLVKVSMKQLHDSELNLDAFTGNQNGNLIGKVKKICTDSHSSISTEVSAREHTKTNIQGVEKDSQFEAIDTNTSVRNIKSEDSDVPAETKKTEDTRRSYASRYKSKKTKEMEDNRLIQIDYEEDIVLETTQKGGYCDTGATQNQTEKSYKDDSSGTTGLALFLKPLSGLVDRLLPDGLKQHMHGIKVEDVISDLDFQAIDFTLPPHEFQKKLEKQQKKIFQKLLKKFSETEDETGSQIIQNQNQSNQKSEDSNKATTCDAKEENKRENEEIDSDKDSDLSLPQSDDEEIDHFAQLDDANWDAVLRLESIKCRQATEVPPRLRCTVLCVDISGSMIGEPWKQIRGVLETFVKGIEDVRLKHGTTELVSIVTFGHETKVALTPTTDYNKIMDTFDKLEVHGNTPLEPVLFLALFPVTNTSNSRYHFRLHGTFVRHRVILLTDGNPTPQEMFSENDFVTDRQAKRAVAAVVKKMKFFNAQNLRYFMNIHCVPIGKDPNMDLLEIICKKSGGQIVPSTDIQRLSSSTHNYLKSLQITRHLLDSGAQTIDKNVLESIINTLYPEISPESMDQMMYEIEYEFKKDRKQKKKDRKNSSSSITDEASDSDSDSDESLNLNGDESDSLAEVDGMPKIGTRVKRGPDFDPTEIVVASETGTITGHSTRDKKCLFVMWDCGVKTYCRYGEADCYDVMMDDVQHVPCKLEDNIKIGHRVRRGPDWQYKNQDGGSDQLGTVYDIHDNGVEIRVRWDNGNFGLYRYNYDGACDVLLSTPDDPFDVLRHTHEMNRRNLAKIRGIDINSAVTYRKERLELDLTESLFGLDLDETTKDQGDTRLNKNAFVKDSNDSFNV